MEPASMKGMTRTEVLPLVEADLRTRVATGEKQYGEPLSPHNGRDALWDAYEEALDLALYLRQAIEERSTGNRASRPPCGHRPLFSLLPIGIMAAIGAVLIGAAFVLPAPIISGLACGAGLALELWVIMELPILFGTPPSAQ